MVAYVKVSVVRKSLANCGVWVRVPLPIHVVNQLFTKSKTHYNIFLI